MSNIKNIAEDIIQLTNKSNLLDDVVSMMNHIMKSTENTLKDDILKITDGAKLECKVDTKKILEFVEEIGNYRYSAEDEISSAQGKIEDASSSISYMEDEINALHSYLEELSNELIEDKSEEKEE